ncbi:MAG: hypothetical protein KDA63_13715, partial [Planctomycetales bacterium]|nr:hypothetical protein [Planctomycetales bacterium]
MTVRTPKYRLHKGSGQALVQIGGRRIYLGKHGTEESKQRYRRLVADWLRGRPAPTTTSNGNGTATAISINAVLLAYWKFAKTYYVEDGEPTSELAGMRSALRPVKELYGATAAEDFGPLCLKAIQQHLVTKGLSRPGINKRINRIRRAFKWAVSEELIPASVHEALRTVAPLKQGRTPAPETEPVKPVSDELVDAVLPHVSPQVAAMIQLQ